MGMISSDGFPFCNSNGLTSGRVWVPSLVDLDWYKYIGVLANEQMCLAPHTDYQTPLTSICAVGDTVINVVSTTGFPATGYLCIEGEAIQYIGKTGTSFTGCTRSKYATTAQIHYPNAVAFIGAWFVKINQGLLLGGFQKPT